MAYSQNNLINYELTENGVPVPFVIRTMEEIHISNDGKADDAHRHSYYTIIWSTKAKGKHVIDFKSYQIADNTIFFVRPGQVHQVLAEANPKGYVLLFTQEFLVMSGISPTFINDLQIFNQCDENPPFNPTEDTRNRLQILMDGLINVCKEGRHYKYDALGAYLKLFLIECNLSFMTTENRSTESKGSRIFRNFKEIVEKDFRKKHKVNEYSEDLAISSNHLNDSVKIYLGKTAKEYIQERIILEAKRLLLFSNLSSKEISYELGFEDPSHFSKFFKNVEGISIMEFKEAR